jgi:RNA polymerase sigma-70 factor (TIGR02957 family)
VTDRERLLDELRPVSFAIAYRMLGSVAEAEDIVQEALLRLHRALEDGQQIQSPRAFVATVTTRLAINELRSARARRERYVGEWLPEPIITDGHDDPARHAEIADSLSLALLVLLESLSPEQRAVLLLHDVFDYGYPEIAAIVGKSEAGVRQLATRARRHVEQGRPRFQTTREQRDELARRFFQAAEQGDLAGLEALLAHDVELTGDGGGKVPALARSLRGRSRVARTLINWARLSARVPGVSLRPVEVNGGPGALYLDAQQRLIAVVALEIADGQITSISSIVNPDKLAHLAPRADDEMVTRASAPERFAKVLADVDASVWPQDTCTNRMTARLVPCVLSTRAVSGCRTRAMGPRVGSGWPTAFPHCGTRRTTRWPQETGCSRRGGPTSSQCAARWSIPSRQALSPNCSSNWRATEWSPP